ncbi:PA3496 family putative envelope integrity protein [Legionella erythra]|uniref:Uncharacterized protein n=1 Tax=Legionella erythra TaxID=448 RepID=A0A0W0TWN3_LEGER|nr:hypothetical protein [Legionella erythra]KTC99920.1 hypothetical protein Lery_0030 [Legionella erythra]
MSSQTFDDFETEVDDFSDNPDAIIIESSPSTKLERRRRIEELAEEKRLREELAEYNYV